MDACRQVWQAAMYFVQSGGMATVRHDDARRLPQPSISRFSLTSLRNLPAQERADIFQRASRKPSDARFMLRLFEGERGTKLIRNWVHGAIVQDEPDAISSFQIFLRHVHAHTDSLKFSSLTQQSQRLKAAAKLVEADSLGRTAQNIYLPQIVADLCARGLMARRDVPVSYIRDEHSLIEALNKGYLTPEQYRQVPCRTAVNVRQLMWQGIVPLTQTTFTCLQPWNWQQLELLAGGRASRWRRLVAWHVFSKQEIHNGVESGTFHVGHIFEPGPNLAGLLEALTATGRLDVAIAMQQGASRWDPHAPWPAYAARYVRRFAAVSDLIDRMPLPDAIRATDHNRRYALRLVAHWYVENRQQMPTKDAAIIPPQSRWQRFCTYLAGGTDVSALPAVQGPLLSACVVCCELFDDLLIPAGLAACLHLPSMDAACLHRGVLANDKKRCPEFGCARLLGPDEILGLHFGPQNADEAAWHIVSTAYASNPNWRFCRTPNCPNGLEVQGRQSRRLDCRCCGKVSVFSKARWAPESLHTLNSADKQHLVTLIAGVRLPHRGPAPAIRECFHCGSATQLIDGCNSVQCQACRRWWNFKWGRAAGHDFETGGQMYVPRRSWLTDLGLYYGADSESVVDAYAVIRSNMGESDLATLGQI